MNNNNILIIAILFIVASAIFDFILTSGIVFIVCMLLNVEINFKMVLIAYGLFVLLKFLFK